MLKIVIKGSNGETITFTVPLEDFSLKKEPDGATMLRYKGGTANYPATVRVTVEITGIMPESAATT